MNSQESINDTYEEVGEMLLIKFVDEKIFGLFKRKGLIGKEVYNEIVKKYRRMSVYDKVRHALSLIQWIKMSLIEAAIEHEKVFDSFISELNNKEGEAIKHLVRINEGNSEFTEKILNMDVSTLSLDAIEQFVERFPIYKEEKVKETILSKNILNMDVPTLSLDAIEEFVQRFPIYKEEKVREIIFSIAQNQNEVKGESDLWFKQCTRCFGLGHIQKECGSPVRIGFIPDVEEKLLQFKGKRRRFNNSDGKHSDSKSNSFNNNNNSISNDNNGAGKQNFNASMILSSL